MWNKSSNKETKVIALTTALNDQRMKSEEFQKITTRTKTTKLDPMKKMHIVIPVVINPS